MEMRTLGRNGPRVSAMGLGCTHAWVLSRGEDIVPLVGMSQPARVADNLRAFDVTLGKQDLADLIRPLRWVPSRETATLSRATSGCKIEIAIWKPPRSGGQAKRSRVYCLR